MTPSDTPIRISSKELSKLEDLTHELSDFMTALLHQISLIPANLPGPLFERGMIITGIITKSEEKLKELLWIFGHILDAVRSKGHLIETPKPNETEAERKPVKPPLPTAAGGPPL